MSNNIITMNPPPSFSGSVTVTRSTPPSSGQTYTLNAANQIVADPKDVTALIGLGFTFAGGTSLAITALNTVGAGTITAAGIVGGVTSRGGSQSGAAFTDTTDTAANIIAVMANAALGSSFVWTYQNGTNATATIAAGSGVTLNGASVCGPGEQITYEVQYTAAGAIVMTAIDGGVITPFPTQAAVATADTGTSQTLTAAMISGGNETFHVTTGGATPSLTLPLGTAMDTALPALKVGQSYKLRVINTNSGTATIVTNTGWTLTGTLTLVTNSWRDFVVTKTGVGTYTAVAVGTGTTS